MYLTQFAFQNKRLIGNKCSVCKSVNRVSGQGFKILREYDLHCLSLLPTDNSDYIVNLHFACVLF